MRETPEADVCLLLEGTYPYVSGGVSSWVHSLVTNHDYLKFSVVCILPKGFNTKPSYQVPPNVISVENVFLQNLPAGKADFPGAPEFYSSLEPLVSRIMSKPGPGDLAALSDLFSRHLPYMGEKSLLSSDSVWEIICRMYESSFSNTSFINYFWSWRSLMGSLFGIFLCNLPRARVYHTICTGYAGMMAARAKMETGRPVILTEHGIYTNERRIEIMLAEWLLESSSSVTLTSDKTHLNLRDFWMQSFSNYSSLCYESCDRVVTLFKSNQEAQAKDGARPEKMQVIANGVDTARFGKIAKTPALRPTIALIGRIVPIKDIKTFIRSVAMIRNSLPEIEALIIGPGDEDKEYYEECLAMVNHLELSHNITFTGKVRIDDYLGRLDVVVLTSISEAQPLVILEAGACGIPCVATDVGSCAELILGPQDEAPRFGEGGIITPLANPQATSEAVLALLLDPKRMERCSESIKRRVHSRYNKELEFSSYKALYGEFLGSF